MSERKSQQPVATRHDDDRQKKTAAARMVRAAAVVTVWLFISLVMARGVAAQPTQQSDTSRLIYLLHAETLSFDKAQNPDRQVLRGDVRFRQDSMYMYCDYAYFYRSTNSMEAYGNVRMEQGDTLHLFCDSLAYDGNTAVARCLDRVRMIHNTTILYTDFLIYDRVSEEAHYPDGGVIVDPDNHLWANEGWYYPQVKEARFHYDVQLRNYKYDDAERDSLRHAPVSTALRDRLLADVEPPHYHYFPNDKLIKPQAILYSDTLTYDYAAGIADVLGPSRIVSDSGTVLTDHGRYEPSVGRLTLFDRSRLYSRGRFAVADKLEYNVNTGIGEGWGDIVMVDTLQHVKLTGEYLHFVEEPRRATVTGRALAMEFSSADTLYLHGDTLRAYTEVLEREIENSLPVAATTDTAATDGVAPDTSMVAIAAIEVATDSVADTLTAVVDDTVLPRMDTVVVYDTLNYMTAHFNVRYYRNDVQGICDSLNYCAFDSLATFVGNPVMWNGAYQITGDVIRAIVAEGGIRRAMIDDNAFLVQQKDSIHYDQIVGQQLVCYFDSSRIEHMDMSGNVQLIYYPEESDKSLIGLNQGIGNYMSVWFKDSKMDHLKLWPDVVGSFTPLPLVTEDILYLSNFRWMEYLRPTEPMDVFRDVRMKEDDKQEVVKLFSDDELNGY